MTKSTPQEWEKELKELTETMAYNGDDSDCLLIDFISLQITKARNDDRKIVEKEVTLVKEKFKKLTKDCEFIDVSLIKTLLDSLISTPNE